jgi:hypothetical protein
MAVEIKTSRFDGQYIVDLGEEGNKILRERYEKFVQDVETHRNDLSPEEKQEIIKGEEEQNCRLIGEWLGRLFDLIKAEAALDKSNEQIEDAAIENECEVYVSKADEAYTKADPRRADAE